MAQQRKDHVVARDEEQVHEIPSTGGGSRRGFLKAATLAIGGVLGAIAAVPIVRYVLFPVGRKTVSGASAPIDVLGVDDLDPSGKPIKVELVGEGVRNGWGVSDRVALGSAYVRKDGDQVVALSSICPHLGCAIGYDHDKDEFKCPCHRSSFALSGDKKSGPAKRGLDPLPVEVRDGRVHLTFVRYKQDVPEREPV